MIFHLHVFRFGMALVSALHLLSGCAGVDAPSAAQPAVGAKANRVPFQTRPEFSAVAVRQGVAATPQQCRSVPGTVWVESREHGSECLRYWKAGFDAEPINRAVVYFHGDVWLGERAGTSPDYLRLTAETLQEQARRWSRELNAPYIFFARPGTHGSSGDHMQRRRRGESVLISLALDELKSRYGVREWVVAGQSGGGHVTASLLVDRSDIVCAVPASSVSSPKARASLHGWKQDSTGFSDSHEPLDGLNREGKHPGLRIFVVGSPEDINTQWSMQTLLADRARAVGLRVEVLAGEGSGPQKHGMANSARIVAGWCARNLATEDIKVKAAGALKG